MLLEACSPWDLLASHAAKKGLQRLKRCIYYKTRAINNPKKTPGNENEAALLLSIQYISPVTEMEGTQGNPDP
jgi:hypothetical protein